MSPERHRMIHVFVVNSHFQAALASTGIDDFRLPISGH